MTFIISQFLWVRNPGALSWILRFMVSRRLRSRCLLKAAIQVSREAGSPPKITHGVVGSTQFLQAQYTKGLSPSLAVGGGRSPSVICHMDLSDILTGFI